MERVTVAIPTLTRLAYLREAVASALRQTYSDIEILIGQDPGLAGLDASVREWCVAAARREPRIRYQANDRNLGLAGNWNALARAARGSFLVIMGDDDRLAPEFAEMLIGARVGKCDVIFSNHHVIDAAGDRISGAGEDFALRYARATLSRGLVTEPERLAWRGAIPMSAALVRTEVARALGFREDLNTPDMEFFIRLARGGGQFCFVPDYLAEYRVHDGSETASGLRLERLVRYLLAIDVAADVEPEKSAALGALLPAAVSCCLRGGDVASARRLLLSPYYPGAERFRLRGIAQMMASLLPATAATRLFVSLQRAASASARVNRATSTGTHE